MIKGTLPIVVLSVAFLLSGCATESSRTVEVAKVQAASTPAQGPRIPVAVGKFDNRSNYMMGVFSDGIDRLGSQAKTRWSRTCSSRSALPCSSERT